MIINAVLPQDLRTTASPTFAGLTLTDLSTAGFVKNSAAGVLSTEAFGTLSYIAYSNGTGLAYSSTLTFDGTYCKCLRFQSTQSTGTAPFTIASTTVNTNLNADLLDGKHVGTSGNTIPLLDGTNTWSAVNTINSQLKVSVSGDADGADDVNGLLVNTTTTSITSAKIRNSWHFFTCSPTAATAQNYIALGGRVTTGLNNIYNFTAGIYGVVFDAYYRGAATCTNLTGLQVTSYCISGTGTVTDGVGINVQAGRVSNTGSVTNSYCIRMSPYNNVTGTGNITTSYGLYHRSTLVTKNVTNAYGIYLENIAYGGTLNYAIYSAGGISYHAGNFGIGKIPTVELDVTGAGLFSTTLGVTGLITATGGIVIIDGANLEKTVSDLTITTAAQKTIVLSQPVYNDANVGALVLQTGGTLPGIVEWLDSTGAATGIYTRGFAVNEQGSGSIEIPHDYKEGTDLTFHAHFGINDAPTGTDYVNWQLKYSVTRDGVVFPASTTITKEVAVDTQYKKVRADFTAITGTNFKIGDQFEFELKRIAAAGDAFAGEALTSTIGFHYQCDTMGSRQIGTK